MLPGGVSRNIVHHNPYPLFCARADGAHVQDVDGNTYLDLLGNYTALVLGHRHPAVVEATQRQLERGFAWAAASPAEAGLAGLIIERLPSAQRVRFTASGTEATMSALRAARVFTGRDLVAKFEGGYHGFHDYAMVGLHAPTDRTSDPYGPRPYAPDGIPPGVRDSMLLLPFNDPERVEALIDSHAADLAAVIVEPIMGVAGVIQPEQGFLQKLRELTSRHGIVLVFDEVMTFRLSWGGAQNLFDVTPDLTTLGKVIGGGFPVGAVCGRSDVMSVFEPPTPKVLLSGTFHAHPVTLAAGVATLETLTEEAIDDLNAQGDSIASWFRDASKQLQHPVQMTRAGSIFNFHFNGSRIPDYRSARMSDSTATRWLHLALLNEGILIGPRGIGCLSTPVTESHLETFRVAVDNAFASLGLS